MTDSESIEPDLEHLRVRVRRPLVAVEAEKRQGEPRWLLLIVIAFSISVVLLLLFYVQFYVFLH